MGRVRRYGYTLISSKMTSRFGHIVMKSEREKEGEKSRKNEGEKSSAMAAPLYITLMSLRRLLACGCGLQTAAMHSISSRDCKLSEHDSSSSWPNIRQRMAGPVCQCPASVFIVDGLR